ncbi:MAG: Asp-tRNA(Asn)/Glu-tRNA(Gln) amidotransferase subunit GatB [Ignavibacteriales bacterium]|nr:Asp-tRNA(Asn)/Glu-tRNA(Gln) amidotransferase subunit GatB [Ignavibacteriales bacterium]
MNSNYEAVIGLEVHAQLLTKSKIFCSCSTEFGSLPNTNVCPICLGHPGVLPVLNLHALEFIIRMGLATGCSVNTQSIFARKNYFYPDLPKGYQISQFEKPVCENGYIEIEENKNIRIKRIHLEEDAGKLIHEHGNVSLVDVNRCGVPLIEIVSEPDIHSSKDAVTYLTKLRQILIYLGICDGNMEEGSLRCDANISVRQKGEVALGTRTEVKNMNSFKNVEAAIKHEINRQIGIIEEGNKVVQETLLWNAELNESISMRGKEQAHDYRYFPEPDLEPMIISDEWKQQIKSTIPELPDEKKKRFCSEYKLPKYDAEILTSSRELANYYEKVVQVTQNYKAASNWIMSDVLKIINERKIAINEFSISAENLGRLINLITGNKINGKIAKKVFELMLLENKTPEDIVQEKKLLQITDTCAIENIVEDIIQKSPEQVEDYLAGKEKIIGYFVGKVMAVTKGKANPQIVNEILIKKLNKKRHI